MTHERTPPWSGRRKESRSNDSSSFGRRYASTINSTATAAFAQPWRTSAEAIMHQTAHGAGRLRRLQPFKARPLRGSE
eukprot:5892566-Lingulodinium_polyedra.AAC.1